MWAISVLIFTGLYVSPVAIVTEERFDSKHSCETFIENVIEQPGFTHYKDGDVYTFTNVNGDTLSSKCVHLDDVE